MASLVTYGTGLRRIDFNLERNGRRRSIRLGRVNAKAAQSIKARVEAIIADKLANRPHDQETATWLGQLDEALRAKLRSVGLVSGAGRSDATLGNFLRRYFNGLAVKDSTRTAYGHTRRNLEEFFGQRRLLRTIAPADADEWRVWLVDDQQLSKATVGRRVGCARSIWRTAIRWKLAAENPFDGVKGGQQANDERKQFIPPETAERLLEAAPDAEWRAIIALSRYGGLRTPSEPFALRWSDIDWDRGTVRVTCPKQAHNERYASRQIPLFPELRCVLLDLFEQAPDGSEYVIDRLRQGASNLRTHFERIIRRAGLEPWPRLFHNLRASRQSELMEDFALPTVCEWLGNSPVIAARHYVTSIDLDSDLRRAAGMDRVGATASDNGMSHQNGFPIQDAHNTGGLAASAIQPNRSAHTSNQAQQPSREAQQNAQQSTAVRGVQALTGDSAWSAQVDGVSEVDDVRQLVAITGRGDEWAILDSNQ